MKILAIDYGQKNIGLAISDELGIVATRLPGLVVKSRKEAIDGVKVVLENAGPDKIIVGMTNKGEIRKQIANFIKELALATDIEIIPWNEDFTSEEAEIGRSKKFKKDKSHSEAARIILQEYLDSEFNRHPHAA